MISDKKKWNKTEKDRKNMAKEKTAMKVTSVKTKYHLNSLKPFRCEPKTNIGDIISSSSDAEEEGVEYKENG